MRALIVAFGSHGDVLPLVAVGAELKRRGHQVTVGTAEPFGPLVRRAGLDFEQLASEAEYREALGHPDLWRPIRGLRRLFAFAEKSIRPAYDFIERSRDRKAGTMVIASTLALGARLAHDALKVPLVTVHLSPLLIQSRHEPPRLPGVPGVRLPPGIEWEFQLGVDEWFVDPMLTPRLNAVRAELGLPPIRRLRHWWNAPRRVLLLCPDWFVAPQPDWPPQLRQTGFPRADALGGGGEADAALENFLAAANPPVGVTFGTAMRHGAPLYRSAAAAASKLGLRTLLMSPAEIDLPKTSRSDVFQVRYAPFGAVLPRCAAVVHHGGVGTTAQAFAAGTPQVIAPLAFDQFDNAQRVGKLGCGVSVGRRRFRLGGAGRALRTVLTSPEIGKRCAEVAALAAGDDGIGRACDEVEAEFAIRRTVRKSPVSPGPTAA